MAEFGAPEMFESPRHCHRIILLVSQSNFDKVCQTVNQSTQIAQQRISKSILDSMTTDNPTLATERHACVYDPMVTPSVSRGSYGHYLRRNANRSNVSSVAQPPPHGLRGCPTTGASSGPELGSRQSKACSRNYAQTTRASPSATDSTTSDMADHALEYQPNRTTRDSRTQDTAHLSHLQDAMSISHPTQQHGDIFIFGNSDNTR